MIQLLAYYLIYLAEHLAHAHVPSHRVGRGHIQLQVELVKGSVRPALDLVADEVDVFLPVEQDVKVFLVVMNLLSQCHDLALVFVFGLLNFNLPL